MSTSVLDCSFLAHCTAVGCKIFIKSFHCNIQLRNRIICRVEKDAFHDFVNDTRWYNFDGHGVTFEQISKSTVTQFQVRGPVTDTYLFLRTITNVYFGIVSLN